MMSRRKRLKGSTEVRKSSIFLVSAAITILLLCAMLVHAAWRQKEDLEALESKRMMVGALKLTDLCLFTDARYIRHLSQTDLHTPFQDHPGALEHFPSGSLVSPPLLLTKGHEKLD
jgi:hypothetical protein